MGTAALTLVGTLLGVLVGFAGNFLIQRQLKSWQREQWILDSKKAEWKELIGTLCRSARSMLKDFPFAAYEIETSDKRMTEMLNLWVDEDSEAEKTIQDRIFIADRVQKEDILNRWRKVVSERDVNRFEKGWNELHAALVKAALDDLKI
jgi:hypothetical protein